MANQTGYCPPKTRRNKQIARRAIAGENLTNLAAEFGITHARVRQIATKYGYKNRIGDRTGQTPILHWQDKIA